MARRRRRSTLRIWILSITVVSAASYMMLRTAPPTSPTASTATLEHENLPLTSVREEPGNSNGGKAQPAQAVPDKPASPQPTAQNTQAQKPSQSLQGVPLLELARQSLTRGDLLNAREQFGKAIKLGLGTEQLSDARHELVRLAEEMIFSPKKISGDPLVQSYLVQPGDNLAKIAKKNQVTPELLARINQLPSANNIRAGQNLKVIQGPFRVEISKSRHELFVYLQDTLVREFPVGLGEEGSTPTGNWRVKNKLLNPTYYPPRGGKIVTSDDPENPLGERWIGLEGTAGEAVGQQRYGIHGTSDPASIGKNMSLGCVRMNNQDVEFLYDLLIVQNSEVVIQP
ncbi:MAG: hypothetical protein HJJLKODD_02019 [Phycisphaerae bacterium]|nr:hypothetical protein [Phycisphaerae bacterium]